MAGEVRRRRATLWAPRPHSRAVAVVLVLLVVSPTVLNDSIRSAVFVNAISTMGRSLSQCILLLQKDELFLLLLLTALYNTLVNFLEATYYVSNEGKHNLVFLFLL